MKYQLRSNGDGTFSIFSTANLGGVLVQITAHELTSVDQAAEMAGKHADVFLTARKAIRDARKEARRGTKVPLAAKKGGS